ncbi:MAG TPA: PVC-type heme-binding CxxCH protein, partial [Verrucomicrobiae bacterium]|nr:PVC-type heme-binding CxxCH protein [Verrucomicrobiae bacterium]
EVSEKDLPRVPPTEPDKALATFQIKNGFRIELVAAEPLVVDPIALAFDENGRLFVVEMRDYPERRNQTPHLGRVRLLEDTDGDGRFDKSTVYVDNLPWPTAVICWSGGIFVGATPDILYCKDTNGDGVADVREVVFTGIASNYAPYDVNKLNVQALFNGFTWGLANRIHAANGGDGGKVYLVDNEFTRAWQGRAGINPKSEIRNPKSLDLRGHDFSFDPRTLTMRLESGGGQYGLSFDDHGRKFVCSNSAHIREVMYEDRYAARNPFFTMPPAALDIAADGPAAEVYRISPDEPWRVIRTRWRVTGLFPGPIEGGGRPSGYFSGATGITIYRGDAFPEDFRENAFVADCGSNLVHRKKLFPDGVELIARRPGDEQKVEFLASRDNWFRPVQMANAPDGTLYLADMYREVIEHPWSLPESIKQHLDLNSGNDRGRIYRVAPDGFKQPKLPHLGAATTKELVGLLEHPNGWHRDTAARLLYERQDKSAVPLLARLLNRSKSPVARMHALYALDGSGALTETHLLNALDDRDALVREHAVRLAEPFSRQSGQRQSAAFRPLDHVASSRPASPWRKLWRKLCALADDPSPRVRYQLAFTLGESKDPDEIKALAGIIRHDASDRWTRAAVLNSLKDGAGEMFEQLAADSHCLDSAGGQEFLRQLAGVIGAKNDSGEVKTVLDFLRNNSDSHIAFLLTRALGDGLRNAGTSLARADSEGKLKPTFVRAKAMAGDAKVSEQIRVQAIQLLALSRFDDTGEALSSLLSSGQTEPVQLAAVAALARFNDSGVNEALLKQWPQLAARVRGEVVAVMLTRSERIAALFKAVEERSVLASDFTAQQVQMLRAHRDPQIREQATRLFGAPPAVKRDDVVKAFLPALQLRGHPGNGKKIYLERCATCHRIGSQGNAAGPDLVTVKTAGKETLLVSILDPNREVAPRYLNYTVDTKSGESFSGLIASESSSSLTLRGPNGTETAVQRSQIARLLPSGQSLMPEGLEVGLTLQDMADLIEYLGVAD